MSPSRGDHQIVGGPSRQQQAGHLDVSANVPERAAPERGIEGLEVNGGIAEFITPAVAMEGMDISAPIQQKTYHLARTLRPPGAMACSPHDRSTRRAAAPRRELTHTNEVAGRRRDVDRVIAGGRTRSAATRADIFEQASNCLMTTIPRDGHRVVTIELRVRVCACVEQQPHGVEVPFRAAKWIGWLYRDRFGSRSSRRRNAASSPAIAAQIVSQTSQPRQDHGP